MRLTVRNLVAGYDGQQVLRGVDLDLATGVTAIIGANAAGKSTLLRCLAELQSCSGSVCCDDRPLMEHDGRVAYLPQDGACASSLTVFEVVLLGLLPRLSWRIQPPQRTRVQEQLAELGIAALAERRLDTLSGGQRQLVFIAQALVRDPQVLLLDEPTNHLDLRHQVEVLGILAALARRRGLVCVVAIHDLGLAARFVDTISVLHAGRIIASGMPAAVLVPAVLAEVYGVDPAWLPPLALAAPSLVAVDPALLPALSPPVTAHHPSTPMTAPPVPDTASCRLCTIHLESLCYQRAWWFRPFREVLATGIRVFAWAYRIDPADHQPRSAICVRCIRFRKNALKERSGLFRWLDGFCNPFFNRVRDSLLTPEELQGARERAQALAATDA